MPARTPSCRCSCGRYLADHIPGARYLEVDSADHLPWLSDPDTILTEIEEFLTGSHAAPAQSHRALRTVLFTDIVASTQHAAAAGDERWRAVLQRFREITADLTERFGGTVVQQHRRRPPGHVRRPDAGHPLRRSLARRRRSIGYRDPRRHPHRRVRTPGRPTSGGLPYTSRRGSSARPRRAKSSSRAPSAT